MSSSSIGDDAGFGERGVEADRVVAGGEEEAVASFPMRILGVVAQLVGVYDGEHVGSAERLAHVALALHLPHGERVQADALRGFAYTADPCREVQRGSGGSHG